MPRPEDPIPLMVAVMNPVGIEAAAKSGSLITAKAALDYMLARLRPQDRFQVIRFSTDVELLFDDGTSHEASAGNIARARNFAAHFVPAGGTAIEPALREACAFFKVRTEDSYQAIHECLATALGMGAEALAPEPAPRVSDACFENVAGGSGIRGDET